MSLNKDQIAAESLAQTGMTRSNVIELTGTRYGRLLVIQRAPGSYGNGGTLWECLCDCGNTTTVPSNSLRTDKTNSCGCLRNETSTIHGCIRDNRRLYDIWRGMIRRCYEVTNATYSRYGGRGITVDKVWLGNPTGLKAFCNWAVNNGYQNNLTLDRKHNDLGYSPHNCRWSDNNVQASNRRVRPVPSTGYMGVHKTEYGKFYATITIHKKQYNLGRYDTAEEAAFARNQYIVDNNLPHTTQQVPIIESTATLHKPYCEFIWSCDNNYITRSVNI